MLSFLVKSSVICYSFRYFIVLGTGTSGTIVLTYSSDFTYINECTRNGFLNG